MVVLGEVVMTVETVMVVVVWVVVMVVDGEGCMFGWGEGVGFSGIW